MSNVYMISLNMSSYLLLVFFLMSYKFLFGNFSDKLAYFLTGILASSLWGFFFNLDGLVLIFMTTELTAMLLLVMTYTKILTTMTLHSSYKATSLIYLILIVCLNTGDLPVSETFTSYYCGLSEVVASDFFMIYHILFTEFIEITITLIMVISFFSIFFILLYFNLKLTKVENFSKNSQIFCLSKQTMQKQSKFNSSLTTFQN